MSDSHDLPKLHDMPAGVTPASGSMFMVQATRGGVVFDADAAIRIAELLCELHHGAEEVALQRPFVATDKGTFWRVEGSRNRPVAALGLGPFFLSIDKHDGRVTEFGQWLDPPKDPLPEGFAMPTMREVMEGKKPDEKE